jgi:AcrR family transcriptional regulator
MTIDETRERVLEAARQVVGAAGLHPWSMSAVADRAEVSRRTLYRYYPSRTHLVDALSELPRVPAGPSEERAQPTASPGRRRLLMAARELFGQRGYDAVSVREIAERAGVTKLMVYRHFGSKAALFQEATMDPIKEFIADFVRRWSAEPPKRRHVIYSVRDFYAALMDVLAEQRDLLRPLLFTGRARHGTEGVNNSQYLERVFATWFEFMDRVMLAETSGEGFRRFDQLLASRLIFGMILSVVLHEDWLLPARADEREHLVAEMANLTVFGILTPGATDAAPL